MITITADASWCPNTKAAGYGVCIEGAGEPIWLDGPIEDAANSAVAEIIAIERGLTYAFRQDLIRGGVEVLVQSDSQAALSAITFVCPDAEFRRTADNGTPMNRAKRLAPALRFSGALNTIGIIAKYTDIKLRLLHVLGHRPNGASTNHQCDRLAGLAMRKRRAELIAP